MRRLFEEITDWLKALVLIFIYVLISVGMLAFARAADRPQATISQGSFLTSEVSYAGHRMRTGIYLEQTSELKGCVLYLEGLGDSIVNHEPLFRELAKAGYRTVTFDYYGQGGGEAGLDGSSGSMNETRLTSAVRSSEIRTQARWMWSHFSLTPDPVRGKTCAHSRRLVIGWSTGGLAAYQLAHERWAQGVVLLAPGIVPRVLVGEAANNWGKLTNGSRVISQASLTRASYKLGEDPHVDSIHPASPLEVPRFALNLEATSLLARHWTIDPSVRGLVLLSGFEDTYVDGTKTRAAVKAHTHFDVYTYMGALHELDNETASVRRDLIPRTISFLNSVR